MFRHLESEYMRAKGNKQALCTTKTVIADRQSGAVTFAGPEFLSAFPPAFDFICLSTKLSRGLASLPNLQNAPKSCYLFRVNLCLFLKIETNSTVLTTGF